MLYEHCLKAVNELKTVLRKYHFIKESQCQLNEKKMHFNPCIMSYTKRNWDELNTELWKMKCIINIRNVIEYFCDLGVESVLKFSIQKHRAENG